ncbi:MAG: hypothetical protein JO033_24930 [Acidobacteriaceae bacterium]|nr:hypothetical protein [Acidobacteriaceae bacterium]
MSDTHTHIAFVLKREGKRPGRWLEGGVARQDAGGIVDLYLDRLPTGGWSGHVRMVPLGKAPPPVEPERPGAVDEQ